MFVCVVHSSWLWALGAFDEWLVSCVSRFFLVFEGYGGGGLGFNSVS